MPSEWVVLALISLCVFFFRLFILSSFIAALTSYVHAPNVLFFITEVVEGFESLFSDAVVRSGLIEPNPPQG